MLGALTADEVYSLDAGLNQLRCQQDDRSWEKLLPHLIGLMRVMAQDHLHGEDLVDDVIQESCLRVQRSIQDYQPLGDKLARAWIRSIVRHASLDALRSERKRRHREKIATELAVHTSLSDHEPDAELLHQLQAALQTLSPRQHAVIQLRYHHGHDFDDIAEHMNLKRSHIHVLHKRALDKLKKRFEKQTGQNLTPTTLSITAPLLTEWPQTLAQATSTVSTVSGFASGGGFAWIPGTFKTYFFLIPVMSIAGITLTASTIFNTKPTNSIEPKIEIIRLDPGAPLFTGYLRRSHPQTSPRIQLTLKVQIKTNNKDLKEAKATIEGREIPLKTHPWLPQTILIKGYEHLTDTSQSSASINFNITDHKDRRAHIRITIPLTKDSNHRIRFDSSTLTRQNNTVSTTKTAGMLHL